MVHCVSVCVPRVMQLVTMCCSVLQRVQRVAVYCSVLQRVGLSFSVCAESDAAGNHVLQCVAVCSFILGRVAVGSSVLQCVGMSCIVLQCVTVCCSDNSQKASLFSLVSLVLRCTLPNT